MNRRAWYYSSGCVGLALLLFVADLYLPLGVSTGSSYVIVVLLATGLAGGRLILMIGALCTLLTIVGYIASEPGGVLWMAVTNRLIASIAIGIITYLAYLRRRCEDKLRQANRELNGFIHSVSHDLRSPLSPILGYTELLDTEFGHCLGENGKDSLDEIEKQTQRVLGMLDDLLEFATAGKLERPAAAVDVEPILRQVLDRWRTEIIDRGGEVRCAPLPAVTVAESQLYQIFDNLIGNAAHYAPGSLIEIGGERAGVAVRYYVRDHGPGIPAEERKLIFQPFRRGTGERTVSGTGIGLTTVFKIARHYGGRAWVEETPGGGSTFWVQVEEPRRSRGRGNGGRTKSTC